MAGWVNVCAWYAYGRLFFPTESLLTVLISAHSSPLVSSPLLSLCPRTHVSDKEMLKKHNITTVVNCTKGEVPEFAFKSDFKYHELDAEDEDDCDLGSYFETVFGIVWAVKEAKEKVLLYCSTGRSVSLALGLSYMLNASKKQEKHLPLKKALEFAETKLPGVSLSTVFKLHLADLEEQLYDEVSISLRSQGRGGRGGKGKRGK